MGIELLKSENLLKNKNLFVNLKNNEKLFLFYSLALFITPIFITNQLIAGTIVNAILIHSAFKNSTKKIMILCALPSIAVLSIGLLFGNLTHFILILMPFIWISNFIIAKGSKKLFLEKKMNYFVSTFSATVAKTIFLFTIVSILFYFALVPEVFLTTFGILQLITGTSGAIIVGFLNHHNTIILE
jgi:hypothetical protein